MSIENKKDYIVNWLNQLRDNTGTISNKDLATKLATLLNDVDFASYSEAQLLNVIQKEDIANGFAAITTDIRALKKTYSDLGANLPQVEYKHEGSSKQEQQKEAGVSTQPSGDSDWTSLLTSAGIPAGIAMLAAKFLGGSMAKFGAGGAAAGMLWTWANSEDGKKMLSELGASLGEGGKGLMSVFSGGAEGLGGIMGSIGDALGSLKDNPVIGGLVDKFKENPLASIALVVAMGMGWNKGNGLFGSMFEMGKYALLALAATWVAEHYLGIGGQSQGHRIADHSPATPANQIADQRVPVDDLQLGS